MTKESSSLWYKDALVYQVHVRSYCDSTGSGVGDVAGMIRSFECASKTVLTNQVASTILKEEISTIQCWAEFWSQWTSTQFLGSYIKTIGQADFAMKDASETNTLLNVFLHEKAVDELAHELNKRPNWAHVPIGGILRILSEAKNKLS